MKTTIKDIAREAGVSPSTVSLVLNKRPCRVALKTRNKIVSIANQSQYQVNQVARSLVTKRSNILGLIIPDIENIFFSALCKRMEEYARAKGYSLIIVNSNDNSEDDCALIDLLISRGVDGIGITVSNTSFQDRNVYNRLSELSIPFVMIDRIYPTLNCNKVYFDNEMGAYLAIERLVKSGHKRIACIGISSTSVNGASRVNGYRKAMQHFRLPSFDNDVLDGDYRFQGGYACASKLIENRSSAAFICNDMMTLGVLRYFQENKIRVPEDYSIVSYDNTLNPFAIGTKITSIDQNIDTLARMSCDILIENVTKFSASKKNICLQPHLENNGSVRKFRPPRK